MDIREQCCENCAYIKKHADEKELPYCRRYPPKVFALPDGYDDVCSSAFPETENGWWCGEHSENN